MTPRRVMLVEDSPTQAQRLRSLLEREGMEVTHVGSAEEGLECFESARPELVLLDYHLPGMNGDGFCREIRWNVNTRAVPVLMLTVDSGDAAQMRGLESGADDYLEKSADPDVLVAHVRRLLRKSGGATSILAPERPFSRARVVVVSESPTYLELIARELAAENFELQRAANDASVGGQQAIDCLIVDCGNWLGPARGSERIATMRQRVGSSPTILLLVESESKKEMLAWLEAGADDYLLKSADAALLRARVRALVRRKTVLDENRRIAEELARKQLEAVRARAEREAAELRATMADQLTAANNELAQANQKLQHALNITKAITDNALEGLFLLDRQGRIEFVSPAASRIFGYEAEELLHRSFHGMLHHHHPDGREYPTSECPIMQALAKGMAFGSHDDVFFRKDGARVDVSYSMAPVAAAGELTGAVAVVHDISDRRRAEERLRHAQELERIGLLAGGIAHDFNNLLVGVLGNASMAADLLPDSHPARELLDGIMRSGEVAANLTRQLLAYAGKGRFVVQQVDLSSVARDTRQLLERSVSSKIVITLQLDPNLPAIESDASQIGQVLMNLVLNAAEAIGDRPGVIEVKTGSAELSSEKIERDLAGWTAQPGPHVFVQVKDTGCGMDAATRARIFEPFFTTKFYGRGLGLAAVAGIVRSQKGGIELETKPGRGAIFRVWLPASTAPRPAQAAAVSAVEDLRGSGAVLIVDDERLVRDFAAKALSRQGYTVLTAASGAEAVETLQAHAEVEAVVLDLAMPGLTGHDTLPLLRRINPNLTVIVSSGYSEVEAQRVFADSCISAYLQKPYTVRDLARKLREARRRNVDG